MPFFTRFSYIIEYNNYPSEKLAVSPTLSYDVFQEFHYKYKMNDAGSFNVIGLNGLYGKHFLEYEYKSIKINNHEYLNDNIIYTKNLPQIKYDFYDGEIIELSFIAKINSVQKLSDYINYCLLFLTYVFYIILFLYLLPKISTLNFYKYQKDFIIFCILFVLCFYFSKPFYTNIDYFNNLPFQTDPNLFITAIYQNISIQKHPYFFFCFVPIFNFFNFFLKNTLLTLGIIYSSISVLSLMILYKLLYLINKNKLISFLLVAIYALSFSQLIFTEIFESYIITGLCVNILLYNSIKLLYNEKKLTAEYFVIFAILAALSFGVTIANIIPIAFVSIYILLNVNTSYKKIFKLIFITTILILCFMTVKGFTSYQRTWINMYTSVKSVSNFSSLTKGYKLNDKIRIAYKNLIAKPFISPSIQRHGELYRLCPSCEHNNMVKNNQIGDNPYFGLYTINQKNFLCIYSFLYLSVVAFALWYIKRVKREKIVLFKLIIFYILYNFLSIIFFDLWDGFLFSQNYLSGIFVLFALSLSILDERFKDKSKVIYYIVVFLLSIFLIYEAINNVNANTVLYDKCVKKQEVINAN